MTTLKPETNLEIESIANLCFGREDKRLRFHIPPYQRGYRWTDHVTKLMDDIYDFAKSKDEKNQNVGSFYCLQPIVMKRRTYLDNEGKDGKAEIGYEVVDGQQRLTTILILLTVLEHSTKDGVFRISYERDNDQEAEREEFLKSIASKPDIEYRKADFSYIRQAYSKAEKWLKLKAVELREPPRQKLLNVLLYQVKVIWYELPDGVDVRTHFRNINAGKIQLTEAELVKAMMLNSRHYQTESHGETGVRSSNETAIRMKQERIARVWDDCERSLQDIAFWGFITCDPYERPTSQRMDFLLELCRKVAPPSDTDIKDDTVSAYFERLLKDENSIQANWNRIRDLFRKIQDWYEDISLYNNIGLLMHYYGAKRQNTLQNLIKESSNYTRPEFCKWVLKEFRDGINISSEQFSQLNYNDNRPQIKWMFMLFNIILMNRLRRRFDFAARVGWSVEHVFASKSVDVNESVRKDWVNRHLRVVESRLLYSDESSKAEIRALEDRMRKYDGSADFGKLFSDYLRLIEKPKGDSDKIGNLALLGLEENIKLQNVSFYDKRKKIISLIEKGCNIPVGTERVFLKSFPETGTSLDYWNEEDGERYVNYMQDIIFKQGEGRDA